MIHQRTRLKENKPITNPHPWSLLPEEAYLDVMLAALDHLSAGVAAMHRANVIHRDIKPSNVMLDQDGNAWLTDLGLAKLMDESGVTRSGQRLGTVGFMAPEQDRADQLVDFRADLFGLGATIYYCLTLQKPFGEANAREHSPPPAPASPPVRVPSARGSSR